MTKPARGNLLAADLVAEAGRELYGTHWSGPASRELGIDRRELRRWMAGNPDNPIPRRAFELLRDLLANQGTSGADRIRDRIQRLLDSPDHSTA
jgi:hypothetical protein